MRVGEAPNVSKASGSEARRCGGAAAGVHDGRVVAPAEARADRGEGLAGVLAREVHRDLARPGHARRAAGDRSSSRREAEGVGGEVLDASTVTRRRARRCARRRGRGRRGPRSASSVVSGRPVSEAKATTRMSAPSSARMLSVRAVGDQLQDAVVGEHDAVVLGALAQDREARGEVGRLDVGDEAGLEALAQAVLERAEVAREAVGGQDDLAAEVVQRVEGVEELLLGLGLGREELDVVDEQDVGVAVAALEAVHVACAAAPRGTALVKVSTVV